MDKAGYTIKLFYYCYFYEIIVCIIYIGILGIFFAYILFVLGIIDFDDKFVLHLVSTLERNIDLPNFLLLFFF